MAHNLNIVNGKASMFYSGEKPWHSLGQQVHGRLTAAEAIAAAGLNYHVEKVAVKYEFKGRVRENSGHFNTVRTDTGDALGVVGKRYEILQNKGAFSFFDAVVGVKDAIYETAGALGRGEKIWLLAKLPGYIRTVGDDVTEKYLLLSNSHDGSGSVQVMFSPIRVVCQNTLNVAIQRKLRSINIRHTASLGEKVKDAQEALGIMAQQFSIFEEASRKIASVQITRKTLKDYVVSAGLVPSELEDKNRSGRARNIMEEVSNLFESGKGAEMDGARGTLWGAFNAVAEYVDHYRVTDREKRAKNLLFGSGAAIKQKAWSEALRLGA